MALRLPCIADQKDMVDYAVSEMLRRFEADLDDGTPMEQAQLVRSPIIDKILAALKYGDYPRLLKKIEEVAKERQDTHLLSLIKELREATDDKSLDKV
jgi:hypothetical protein